MGDDDSEAHVRSVLSLDSIKLSKEMRSSSVSTFSDSSDDDSSSSSDSSSDSEASDVTITGKSVVHVHNHYDSAPQPRVVRVRNIAGRYPKMPEAVRQHLSEELCVREDFFQSVVMSAHHLLKTRRSIRDLKTLLKMVTIQYAFTGIRWAVIPARAGDNSVGISMTLPP